MAVTVVGELVVGGRELLEALERDCVEVATEFSVLGENHRAARHERVDQRSLVLILSHLLLLLLLFSQICAFEPDFGNCVVCASVYLHSLLFLFFSFLFFPLREKEQRERWVRKKNRVYCAYKAGDVSDVAFNPWKVNKVFNYYLINGFNYCQFVLGFKMTNKSWYNLPLMMNHVSFFFFLFFFLFCWRMHHVWCIYKY